MSVYDRGTYEIEKWEPKKIVVTLAGKRVHGTYALFQTGGDGKDWMIHRMDNPEATGDPPPEHVVPMMATLSQLPQDEHAYTFEVKWDGMRAIAYSEPGRLRLETRTLRDITSGFPELGRLQRATGCAQGCAGRRDRGARRRRPAQLPAPAGAHPPHNAAPRSPAPPVPSR